MLVLSGGSVMSEWRKIEVPGPEGEVGYMLIPPDETKARGPFWEDPAFVDHIVYALNLADTVSQVGLSIPVPEPENYDIIFTPARKPRAKSPTRRTKK